MEKSTNAIIEVAKERREETELQGIITLSSGVRARILSVAASLIDQVTAKIKDPDPPMWHNEDKDRDEPNYADPVYIRRMGDAERERGVAAMDALIMFGVELVDGLPEDNGWLKKLKFLGVEIDEKDQLAVEFAYKKFVATSVSDLSLITAKSGISAEDVAAAEKSFRS